MARFNERTTGELYDLASQWKHESLMQGTSLLSPGESVRTLGALEAFKSCFIGKPDVTADSFEANFQRQLAQVDASVTRLECELLLLNFLFSSNVNGSTKRAHKRRRRLEGPDRRPAVAAHA